MNKYSNKKAGKEYLNFADSDDSNSQASDEESAIEIEEKKISLTKNKQLRKRIESNVKHEFNFKHNKKQVNKGRKDRGKE